MFTVVGTLMYKGNILISSPDQTLTNASMWTNVNTIVFYSSRNIWR